MRRKTGECVASLIDLPAWSKPITLCGLRPNAKYWAIHMLAKEMGFGVKSLFNATFSAAAAASPPPPVGTIGAALSTAL